MDDAGDVPVQRLRGQPKHQGGGLQTRLPQERVPHDPPVRSEYQRPVRDCGKVLQYLL